MSTILDALRKAQAKQDSGDAQPHFEKGATAEAPRRAGRSRATRQTSVARAILARASAGLQTLCHREMLLQLRQQIFGELRDFRVAELSLLLVFLDLFLMTFSAANCRSNSAPDKRANASCFCVCSAVD